MPLNIQISDGAFKGLEKLKVLHFDGNMLIAFPVWEITSNRQMIELRLSANWWQCHCEFVRKFRMFIDAHIGAIPDAKSIKCTSLKLFVRNLTLKNNFANKEHFFFTMVNCPRPVSI